METFVSALSTVLSAVHKVEVSRVEFRITHLHEMQQRVGLETGVSHHVTTVSLVMKCFAAGPSWPPRIRLKQCKIKTAC